MEDPETGDGGWKISGSTPVGLHEGTSLAGAFSYSCEVPMPFIRLPAFIPVPLLFMLVLLLILLPLLFMPAPFMPIPLFMPEPDPVADKPVAVEPVVPLPPPILVCASAGPAIESASAIIISFFIFIILSWY